MRVIRRFHSFEEIPVIAGMGIVAVVTGDVLLGHPLMERGITSLLRMAGTAEFAVFYLEERWQ
jgi:hypothetical protein